MDTILSIDQSTSSTKAFIWDMTGLLLGSASVQHKQWIDKHGWVEHNPEEIYANVLIATKQAIEKAKITPEKIRVLGISNQRETIVCWDAYTGRPLHNAIVWQCGRAANLIREMEKGGWGKEVRKRTGLPLSPFFSAAKLCWLVRNDSVVRDSLKAGRLFVGTIDSWLVYKLCGNHATDYSNASRTQLMNLDTLQWDEELLSAFDLRKDCMPEIVMSDSAFGNTDMEGLLPHPIPIQGVMGDSHAALLANNCLKAGEGKVTYGTGSSIMVNAGDQRPKQPSNLAVSLAWGIGRKVQYVLEGNINDCGSTITWLQESIGLIHDAEEGERIARSISDTGGVYLVPAFSGLGAPWFNNEVRAMYYGMNRATRKPQMVRAAFESMVYQVTDVVHAMESALCHPLSRLSADGKPTQNDFLMQFQADILGMPMQVNRMQACSASGAALCAGIGSGLLDPGKTFLPQYREYIPTMTFNRQKELYNGWCRAVSVLMNCIGESI